LKYHLVVLSDWLLLACCFRWKFLSRSGDSWIKPRWTRRWISHKNCWQSWYVGQFWLVWFVSCCI